MVVMSGYQGLDGPWGSDDRMTSSSIHHRASGAASRASPARNEWQDEAGCVRGVRTTLPFSCFTGVPRNMQRLGFLLGLPPLLASAGCLAHSSAPSPYRWHRCVPP